jgi:hypothetical protein
MNILGVTVVKSRTKSVNPENSTIPNITHRLVPWRSGRYLIIALLAFGLIGFSAILEVSLTIPPSDSVFHHATTLIQFVNELGFAFLISLIIIMGLEQRSRDEFNITVNERITNIQDNVFKSTFSRNIPKSVIDEVDNLVLRADFTRENHTASYRFRLTNAQTMNIDAPDVDVLVANVSVAYRIRNVSGVRKSYNIRPGIETSPIQELDAQSFFEELMINDVQQNLESEKSGNFIRLLINTADINPGDAARVLMRYQAIKHVRDYEIWRSLIPSDGMTLRVNMPPGVPLCAANALHRAALTPLVRDTANGYYEWLLDQAVLPHQGIIFWWEAPSHFRVERLEAIPSEAQVGGEPQRGDPSLEDGR